MPPTGFSAVVTAKTIGRGGGVVVGTVSGGELSLRVPKGAYGKAFQAAIAKGSKRAVRKNLPKALRRDEIIAGFAIELRHGSSAVRASKPLTVTFKDRRIARGSIVAIYNEKTGRFQKAKAKITRGRLMIRLRAGETIAILAPHRGGHRSSKKKRG